MARGNSKGNRHLLGKLSEAIPAQQPQQVDDLHTEASFHIVTGIDAPDVVAVIDTGIGETPPLVSRPAKSAAFAPTTQRYVPDTPLPPMPEPMSPHEIRRANRAMRFHGGHHGHMTEDKIKAEAEYRRYGGGVPPVDPLDSW